MSAKTQTKENETPISKRVNRNKNAEKTRIRIFLGNVIAMTLLDLLYVIGNWVLGTNVASLIIGSVFTLAELGAVIALICIRRVDVLDVKRTLIYLGIYLGMQVLWITDAAMLIASSAFYVKTLIMALLRLVIFTLNAALFIAYAVISRKLKGAKKISINQIIRIIFLIAVIAIIPACYAGTSDFKVGVREGYLSRQVEYELTEDDTYVVKSVKAGLANKVVIPDKVNGKEVVGISKNAFYDDAFIGFFGTHITEVDVPYSVKFIEEGAFSSLKNVKTVILRGDEVKQISKDAFPDNDKFKVEIAGSELDNAAVMDKYLASSDIQTADFVNVLGNKITVGGGDYFVFHTNGGSAIPTATVNDNSFGEPYLEGCQFIGWSTDTSYASTVSAAQLKNLNTGGSTHLYAKYRYIAPSQFEVDRYIDGTHDETGKATYGSSVEYYATVTLPASDKVVMDWINASGNTVTSQSAQTPQTGKYTKIMSLTDVSQSGEYRLRAKVVSDVNYIEDSDYGSSNSVNVLIYPREVDVKVSSETAVYNALTRNVTAVYNDVNGISQAVTVTPDREIRDVGSYQLSYSISDDNYKLKTTGGSFTVTKAQLTVQPVNTSVIYGTEWERQLSISDFAANESVASRSTIESELIAALNCGNYTVKSPVGFYPVMLSESNKADLLDNYTVNYIDAEVEVRQKELTVNAIGQNVTYGEAKPQLTADITGYALGENYDFDITQQLYTDYEIGSPVDGFYLIGMDRDYTPTENYYVTFVPSEITVERRLLDVQACGQEIIYGTAAASLNADFNNFASIDDGRYLTELVLSGLSTSYETGDNVGEYPISLSDERLLDNYLINYEGADISVNKATLEVSATDTVISYGDLIPNFVLTYGEFAATEAAGPIEDLKVVVNANTRTNYRIGSGIGEYNITLPDTEVLQNYSIEYTPAILTVETKKITVQSGTFAIKSKVYGENDPDFTYILDGVNNETLVFTIVRQDGQNVNTYQVSEVSSITVEGGNGDLNNYEITTLVDGDNILHITKAPLTVSAVPQSVVYGDEKPELNATVTGYAFDENYNDEIIDNLFTTYSQGDSVDGTYTINIQDGYCPSDNYELTYNPAYVTVLKGTLTVTATPVGLTYGDERPELGAQITGYYSDDNFDSEIIAKLFTGYVRGAAAGSYKIVLTDTDFLTNYKINYTDALITVGRYKVTVASGAFEAKTKVYGESDPELKYTVEGAGGEILEFTINRSSGQSAGEYIINSYSVQVKGSSVTDTRNYEVTASISGNKILTIEKAPLTVQPINTTVIYGTEWIKQASITGYVSIETEQTKIYNDVVNALNYGRYSVNSSVGYYPITFSESNKADLLDNYTVIYIDAEVEVRQKELTVKAIAKNITYGDDVLPEAEIKGYALDENYDTQILLQLTTQYYEGAGVGVYGISITDGYAPSGNYYITYTPADLTVGKKALTVRATPQTITYGTAAESLNAIFSGFAEVDLDKETELKQSVLAQLTTTYNTGDDVGSYFIELNNTDILDNYSISFTESAITVSKAELTVTAVAQTVTYGDGIPAFGLTYGSFAATESETSIAGLKATVSDALTCGYKAGSNVGSYPIDLPNNEILENYTINYASANVTVNPKSITVASGEFAANTKVYGETDPELKYTVTGVNNETLVFTVTRSAGENADTYRIESYTTAVTGGNADLNNYSLDVKVSGDDILTITKAELTVTAVAQAITYGDEKPELNATVTGYKNGDNFNTQIKANLSTTYVQGSSVGSYPISLERDYAPSANYTVKYISANVTVNQKAITVTEQQISAKTKIYGDKDPQFVYGGFAGVNGETIELSFTRDAGENVDDYSWINYSVTVSGGNASIDNYNLTVDESAVVLHITSATLIITPNSNQGKTYGDNDGDIDYSVSGLKNGDTKDILSGALSRASGENVGNYAINLGSLKANNNYSLQLTQINYIIEKKVITANVSASKEYGADEPEFFSKTLNGINGEKFTVTYSRKDGEEAGKYDYTLISVSDDNYAVELEGKFIIEKKVISANVSASKEFGARDPEFRKTLNGINDEKFTVSYSRKEGEEAGEYDYILISVSDNNYDVELEGKFIINQLSLPANLTGTEGDSLSSVSLPEVSNGTWRWADGDEFLGMENDGYEAIFTPANGEQTVTAKLTVTVEPKQSGETTDPDSGSTTNPDGEPDESDTDGNENN